MSDAKKTTVTSVFSSKILRAIPYYFERLFTDAHEERLDLNEKFGFRLAEPLENVMRSIRILYAHVKVSLIAYGHLVYNFSSLPSGTGRPDYDTLKQRKFILDILLRKIYSLMERVDQDINSLKFDSRVYSILMGTLEQVINKLQQTLGDGSWSGDFGERRAELANISKQFDTVDKNFRTFFNMLKQKKACHQTGDPDVEASCLSEDELSS